MDQVAAKTGLSRRVIAAWALAEQSGGAAKSYRAKGYNNWLNIGAFDSGFGDIYHDPTWRSPDKAAAATADFLKGRRFGASGGIRKILDSAGSDPGAQIAAIARSGWASSGYEGGASLRTLYGQLGWMKDSKSGGVVNGGGRATTSAAPGTTASSAGGDGLAALTAVLAARQKPVLQSAGVQAPSFSARPAMPQGYQQASSGGAPQQEKPQSIGDILAAAGYGSAGEQPVTASAADAVSGDGSPTARTAFAETARQRAETINAWQKPYLWGGGHAGKVDLKKAQPLDCSGAVSAVLGINPRVSGQFTTWGRPGRAPGGKGVTIYANKEHVLMEIDGRFFGTSKSNPGGGAGWIPRGQVSREYLRGFTARHTAR